jgi:hypothetical protein
MKDPGELRIMESSEPDKSREEKSRAEANAAWLRLYNSSPLPIQIPTQSFYLPQPKCSHQFSETLRVPGLCDNAEIAVWFRLQDKNGKPLRYGFDSGSSAVLLPGTSVLFAVPLAILKNDNAITFGFTFQKSDMRNQVSEYGTRKILRFPAKELGRN